MHRLYKTMQIAKILDMFLKILGGALPLIFCMHVHSGPIYWGVIHFAKGLEGDGILHVESLKIFYVILLYCR